MAAEIRQIPCFDGWTRINGASKKNRQWEIIVHERMEIQYMITSGEPGPAWTIGVASQSRGSWTQLFSALPFLCNTFIVLYYLFLYRHDFSFPRQSRTAGSYWKWLLWYHLQSTTENGWFGMCKLWDFRVPRLIAVSCRYSRARNSNFGWWASEIKKQIVAEVCVLTNSFNFITDWQQQTHRNILKDLHFHIVRYHDRYVDRR